VSATSTRRVVLTGGPGGGKTTVLDLIEGTRCEHVRVLPEVATILFGGGFPRSPEPAVIEAAQRSIFYVQRELETAALAAGPAVLLCDRGTIDGLAYSTSPMGLLESVGTSFDDELARYDVVIHLHTPTEALGYNNRANPLRTETAEEACALDARIAEVWAGHPRRFFVDATADFGVKARRVIELLRAEMPEACASGIVPDLERLRVAQ
jgi:predicted ATPase